MKDIETRKKTCPKCQTVFPCLTENCWCNELPRIMPLSGSENEDCLCPGCLKAAIDNKMKAAV